MDKTWNTENTKAGKDAEQKKHSYIAGGNEKWYTLEDNLLVS